MKLGIMQPYFFPYLGYWQLIKAVDKYVIYDDVNFIKGGWINRNKILMNGQEQLINLRLHNASPNKLINEVEVLGNPTFNKKLLKSLESCYKKAPYYSKAFPVIQNIINQEEKNLASYLEYSIKEICSYLAINTELIVSSTINKNNALRGQEKVIEICKLLGQKEYLNPIGGEKLYSYEDFSAQGIQLKFLKTGEVEYQQFKNKFVPSLSIIDVMMFNSLEQIKEVLGEYELMYEARKIEDNIEDNIKSQYEIQDYQLLQLESINGIRKVLYAFDKVFTPCLSERIADLDTYSEKLYKNAVIYIAKTSDILGVVALYVNDKASKIAYITGIAVKPQAQGKGIGQALLNKGLELSKQREMCELKLEVYKSNTVSILFYKKNGFEFCGEASEQFMYMSKQLK